MDAGSELSNGTFSSSSSSSNSSIAKGNALTSDYSSVKTHLHSEPSPSGHMASVSAVAQFGEHAEKIDVRTTHCRQQASSAGAASRRIAERLQLLQRLRPALLICLPVLEILAVHSSRHDLEGSDCQLMLFTVLCEAFIFGLAFLACAADCWPRLLRKISPHGPTMLRSLLVWSACSLLTLSAPSRRCRFLGFESSDMGSCDEGAVSLWIALLLGFVAISQQLPIGIFAILSQIICLQHLVISACFPCSGNGVRWNPTIMSALQLHVLVGQFAFAAWRLSAQDACAKIMRDFAKDIDIRHEDGMDITATGWLVKLLDEMVTEELHCRQMVYDLQEALPVGEFSLDVTAVLSGMADFVTKWSELLQTNAKTLRVAKSEFECEDTPRMRMRRHSDTLAESMIRNLHQMAVGKSGSNEGIAAYLEQTFLPSMEQEVQDEILRCESITEDEAEASPGASPRSDPALSRKEHRMISDPARIAEMRLGQWDLDTLKLEQDHGPAVETVGFELLRSMRCLDKRKLHDFLVNLKSGYVEENDYHTQVHAADVCSSVQFLVHAAGLWHILNDAKRISLLIAALGHDLGHFGRNNMFLIKTRHHLATTFNDRSVLENYHCGVLFRLLEPDRDSGQKHSRSEGLLAEMSYDSKTKTRQFMIALILATDTQHHLEDLSKFNAALDVLDEGGFDPINSAKDQQDMLCFIFRSADIGHSAKPWSIHVAWSERVSEEFHKQGDEEKKLGIPISPLCDRQGFQLAKSQLGFLKFICLPTWNAISRFEENWRKRYRHDCTDQEKPVTLLESESTVKPTGARRISWSCEPSAVAAALQKQSGQQKTDGAGGRRISWSYEPSAIATALQKQSAQQKTDESSWNAWSGAGEPAEKGPITVQVLGQCEANFKDWEIQAANAEAAATSQAKDKAYTGSVQTK